MNEEDRTMYTVGDMCSLLNITRKTLFYYDRIGLLKPVRRVGTQKYKEYDSTSLAALEKIIEYRSAGLKISEIQQLMNDGCADRKAILTAALRRIIAAKKQKEKEIEKLQELIREER